jgi:hypothetical protein
VARYVQVSNPEGVGDPLLVRNCAAAEHLVTAKPRAAVHRGHRGTMNPANKRSTTMHPDDFPASCAAAPARRAPPGPPPLPQRQSTPMLATAGRPAVAVPLISGAGSSHRNPVSQVFTAVRRCVKKVIQGSAVAGTGFPVCQLRELEAHGDRRS